MVYINLDIQRFADGKVVIDTELNSKNFEKGLDKMKNTSQKAGSTVKSIVAGLGISKMISVSMNQISGSIDGAVKRIDTFNAYPKVLKNFGVSAEEAQKSIDRIDKSVRGLPTSLDQAVGGVQNLFMVTKDLGEAENLFKAINDSAMVFANGSTEAVDRFSYAFKQAMSSGKVSAQDFNQMNEAIPGLMDKVAESMGLTYSSLKQGLGDGSISIEQFNDALKKLDTEGGAGMSALEKAAKSATGGIKTSIANMQTAITRGVSNVITELDKGLEKFGGISGIIGTIGSNFEKGLSGVGKILGGLLTDFDGTLENLKNTAITKGPAIIQNLGETIVKHLPDFVKKAEKLIKALVEMIIANLPEIAKQGINIVTTLAKSLVDSVVNLIDPAIDLLMTIVDTILDNLPQIIETGIEIILKLVDGILNAIPKLVEKIPQIIEALVRTLTNPEMLLKMQSVGPKLMVSLAKALIANIPNLLLSIPRIVIAIFKGLVDNIKNTNWIQLGKDIIKGILDGLLQTGTAIKNAAKKIVNEIKNNIKSFFKIKSPSKVMADEVGKYLPLGIFEGFDDELDGVYDDMQKAIDIETAKMSANVQTNGTYQMAISGLPEFNLMDNSTQQIQLVANGKVLADVVNTENRNRKVASA